MDSPFSRRKKQRCENKNPRGRGHDGNFSFHRSFSHFYLLSTQSIVLISLYPGTMFLADCSRRSRRGQLLAIFLGCSLIDMVLSTVDFDFSSAFSPPSDDPSLWTTPAGDMNTLDPGAGTGFSSDLSLLGPSLTGTNDGGLFENLDYSNMFGTDDPNSPNLDSESQLWIASADFGSDPGSSGALEEASTCVGGDGSPFYQNIGKKTRRGHNNPTCSSNTSPDYSNLKYPDLLPIAPPDSESDSELRTDFGVVTTEDDEQRLCQKPYGTHVCCTGPGSLWTQYYRIFEAIQGCTPCMFVVVSLSPIDTLLSPVDTLLSPLTLYYPPLTLFVIALYLFCLFFSSASGKKGV